MSDLGNREIMAANIKRCLEERGMSQSDLCNALGLKQMTVSDWCNAKTYPRIDKIEMMAKFFGVSKAVLVEEHKEEGYYLDPETAKKAQELFDNPGMRILFDAARDARPEDLQKAADYLKAVKAMQLGLDDEGV